MGFELGIGAVRGAVVGFVKIQQDGLEASGSGGLWVRDGAQALSELAALHNVPSVTARYPTTSLQISAVDMSPPVECGCIDLNSRTAKDCFNRNY